MGEFIKSAFGYLGNSISGNKENEFVGQIIEVGKQCYRIKRVVAEGGYAVVFEGIDTKKGKSVAIKRLLAHDQETSKVIVNEIDILKKICGGPNIMQFYSAACVGKEKMKHVGTEFLIVTEYCSGGSLYDFLPTPRHQRPLSCNIVLQVVSQACRAIQHMHKQSPPIIHRDLKVENLLLSDIYTIKLCDFGSATTQTYSPDITWSAIDRGKVQEDMERVTTPIYRAPEMLDLYLNYPINEALDIWSEHRLPLRCDAPLGVFFVDIQQPRHLGTALGCIFFYLICGYHPFEDSAKLAILNANYNLPACNPDTEPFHNLIRQTLLVDPTQRPNISTIVGELEELSKIRSVDADGSIIFNDEVRRHLFASKRNDTTGITTKPLSGHSSTPQTMNGPPPPRPAKLSSISAPADRPPALSQNATHHKQPHLLRRPHSPTAELHEQSSNPSAEAVSSTVFGFFKGGAGQLMKNLREVSFKVRETVTAAMPSDLDLQYITSRIAVMSYPAESGLEVLGSRNSMEEAQTYLDKCHANSYAVYNLSSRVYRSEHWFDGRVSQRPFEQHRAPSLFSLVELCQNARLWLAQKPGNICVIHCTDGRQLSAVLVCCLLCFCNVFHYATTALAFFSSKRGPVSLTAAQLRYVGYVSNLVSSPPRIPHNHPLLLFSITLAPVPTFNRLKDGFGRRTKVEMKEQPSKQDAAAYHEDAEQMYNTFKTRNGCRPYVDVVQNGRKVYSTMTDYASLRTYFLEDRKIEIILNGISVYGDVTISVYHARSLFAGKGKAAAAKICQLQFHSGYIDPEAEKLSFMKNELDHLDSTSGFAGFTSRYAESFHVSVHLMCSPKEQPRLGMSLVYPWETLPPEASRKPDLCFSGASEMLSVRREFGEPIELIDQRKQNLESLDGSSDSESSSIAEPSAPPMSAHKLRSTNFNGRHCPLSELHASGSVAIDEAKALSEASTGMLIEGLDWNQTPADAAPSFPQPTNQASASVAEVFGFTSNVGSSVIGSNGTGASTPKDLDFNKPTEVDAPLLNDLFLSSSRTPPTTSRNQAVKVEDPWSSLTQDVFSGMSRSTSANINTNPFDPFGTATCPPELFDSQPQYQQPKAQTDDTFDPFGTTAEWLSGSSFSAPQTAAASFSMHTSNSTSDLHAPTPSKVSPHHSASSLNLSSGGSPESTVPGAAHKTPFDAFDVFFEAAAAAARSGSPAQDQSPLHRPPVASDNAHSSTSGAETRWTPAEAAFTVGGTSATSSPMRQQPGPGRPTFNTQSGTGTRPRVSKDAFADLLSDFGVDPTGPGCEPDSSKVSMKELRRMKLADSTDPDMLKILAWTEGKERNVRALLCNLTSIMWDGVRWSQISMADVMTVNQVKRQYRNAARAVHPDKWMNTPHQNMARLVLVELNDAMAEFERIEQSVS